MEEILSTMRIIALLQVMIETTMLSLMMKIDGKDKWGLLPAVKAVIRKTGRPLLDEERPTAPNPNLIPAVNGMGFETECVQFDIEKAFCHQLVQMSRVNGWENVDLREDYWIVQKPDGQSRWVRLGGASPEQFRAMIEGMLEKEWLVKKNPQARNSRKGIADPSSIRRRAYS